MQIQAKNMYGRKGWELSNDRISIFLMAGGGHIASLKHRERPSVNPLWAPAWKSIEPWAYRPKDAKTYGVKLLACIFGHNLCLSEFGTPSPEELKAGIGPHGEAPVVRWTMVKKRLGARQLSFTYGCVLPIAQMRLVRTVTLGKGSEIVRVKETLINLCRRDVPFTMCQHVSFGPPFLERGVTAFDMSATLGHTFPGPFGNPQRLKPSTDFRWPNGPGPKGKVDLRFMGRAKNGDFSAQLMNPARDWAWFSAVNPRLGVLVAYVWRRKDYPWLGNWEENYARKETPWNGKSLARGMEFGNSPFPTGVRDAVNRGEFQEEPTFRWLPALGRIVYEYSIIVQPVKSACKGVKSIHPAGRDFDIL
ncbi:MAG: hypothetical protein HY343_09205 [Lentisphaerae bacterium]|nr:hypothetical protein [Lentisphaerota bacterium]